MPYRNPKARKAAEGEHCTLNFPGCNHDPRTSVLCHLNEHWAGKGMGQKAHDFAAVIGCSVCHDILDGRAKIPEDYKDNWKEEKWWHISRALVKTLDVMFDKGVYGPETKA